MIESDLDINRAIRRVLVKHWIDLGRLSIRTTQGRVTLFGLLRRIEGQQDQLLPPVVEAMMYEIGRIRGVNAVRAHFDNWINDGGHWRPHERANLEHRHGAAGREEPPPASAASA